MIVRSSVRSVRTVLVRDVKQLVTSSIAFTAKEDVVKTVCSCVNSVTWKSARNVTQYARIARRQYVENVVRTVIIVTKCIARLVRKHCLLLNAIIVERTFVIYVNKM